MSLNKKYTSLNEVLERVRRDFGFEEIYSHDAKEWVWDAIGLAGAPNMLITKTSVVEVRNWRGELPVDLFSLSNHQIRDSRTGAMLNYSEDSFHLSRRNSEGKLIVSNNANSIFYIDEERTPEHETQYPSIMSSKLDNLENFGYTINNNFIFTSDKNMELEISYTAFPMDEETLEPLIPDDPAVLRAVVWYIGERTAFKLMLADKLSERKYEMIKQDYLFNMGSAITKANILSMPEIENIKNRTLQYVKSLSPFQQGFKNL